MGYMVTGKIIGNMGMMDYSKIKGFLAGAYGLHFEVGELNTGKQEIKCPVCHCAYFRPYPVNEASIDPHRHSCALCGMVLESNKFQRDG